MMDRKRKTKAEMNYGLRTTMVSGADEGAFVTVYICALSTSPRNFATFNRLPRGYSRRCGDAIGFPTSSDLLKLPQQGSRLL